MSPQAGSIVLIVEDEVSPILGSIRMRLLQILFAGHVWAAGEFWARARHDMDPWRLMQAIRQGVHRHELTATAEERRLGMPVQWKERPMGATREPREIVLDLPWSEREREDPVGMLATVLFTTYGSVQVGEFKPRWWWREQATKLMGWLNPMVTELYSEEAGASRQENTMTTGPVPAGLMEMLSAQEIPGVKSNTQRVEGTALTMADRIILAVGLKTDDIGQMQENLAAHGLQIVDMTAVDAETDGDIRHVHDLEDALNGFVDAYANSEGRGNVWVAAALYQAFLSAALLLGRSFETNPARSERSS